MLCMFHQTLFGPQLRSSNNKKHMHRKKYLLYYTTHRNFYTARINFKFGVREFGVPEFGSGSLDPAKSRTLHLGCRHQYLEYEGSSIISEVVHNHDHHLQLIFYLNGVSEFGSLNLGQDSLILIKSGTLRLLCRHSSSVFRETLDCRKGGGGLGG